MKTLHAPNMRFHKGPLEPVFVFPGEAIEIMVKDSVEGGPLGPPGAVEFRIIESRLGYRRFHPLRSGKEQANPYRFAGPGNRCA